MSGVCEFAALQLEAFAMALRARSGEPEMERVELGAGAELDVGLADALVELAALEDADRVEERTIVVRVDVDEAAAEVAGEEVGLADVVAGADVVLGAAVVAGRVDATVVDALRQYGFMSAKKESRRGMEESAR